MRFIAKTPMGVLWESTGRTELVSGFFYQTANSRIQCECRQPSHRRSEPLCCHSVQLGSAAGHIYVNYMPGSKSKSSRTQVRRMLKNTSSTLIQSLRQRMTRFGD